MKRDDKIAFYRKNFKSFEIYSKVLFSRFIITYYNKTTLSLEQSLKF